MRELLFQDTLKREYIMKTIRRVIFALCALLVTVTIISAQNPPPQPENDPVLINNDEPHHFGKGNNRPMLPPPFLSPIIKDPVQLQNLLSTIGVNKQSSDAIVGITKTFFKTLDSKVIQIQRLELDIREELTKDKPDLKNVQTLINKKVIIFGEIEFLQIKRDLDIKANLTDIEFDKWKAAVNERKRLPHDMNIKPRTEQKQ
jgi:hypothetical protein